MPRWCEMIQVEVGTKKKLLILTLIDFWLIKYFKILLFGHDNKTCIQSNQSDALISSQISWSVSETLTFPPAPVATPTLRPLCCSPEATRAWWKHRTGPICAALITLRLTQIAPSHDRHHSPVCRKQTFLPGALLNMERITVLLDSHNVKKLIYRTYKYFTVELE